MKNFSLYQKRLHQEEPIAGKWLFLVLLGIFLPQIFITYNIVSESIMTDLHSRVIGSRLLSENRSPYFFNWHPGDAIELFDPNTSMPHGLNGVTATPFFLWLQKPLGKLSYCNIKLAWWIIEESLLFLTVFFACLYPSTLYKQAVTVVVAAVFFIYSRNWWLHIYAGQYYVLFAFIFSLATWLTKKKEESPLVIFPAAALLRPFFALAILPFLLRNLKLKVKPLIIGIAVAVILLIVSASYQLLPEYNKAMKLYSLQIFDWQTEEVVKNEKSVPSLMEACVYSVSNFNNYNAGCLFSLQHYLKLGGIQLTNPIVYSVFLLFFLFLFIVVTGLKRISINKENTIIASFLIYIFCELFTPAFRNPYNLIQYVAILGLLIDRSSPKSLLLLVAGLALNHDIPFRFQYQREVGEILILLSIYLVMFQHHDFAMKKSSLPTTDNSR